MLIDSLDAEWWGLFGFTDFQNRPYSHPCRPDSHGLDARRAWCSRVSRLPSKQSDSSVILK
jgi:hypothetical protein